MNPIIIIPAFNEQDNILGLINKIKLLDVDYLIINDHSIDNTSTILKQHKLNHMDLPNNVGIAGVTQMGFRYAIDHGYDAAIVIDGDGQHPPKYVHKLLDELNNDYDYVIGSRFVENDKPWNLRMIGSRIIVACIYLTSGKKISDPTSGMRALGKRVLEEFAKDMNYIAEPDALAYLLKSGYRVHEVQIEMDERQGGQSYFVDPLKSLKFMISVTISILFVQVLRGKHER